VIFSRRKRTRELTGWLIAAALLFAQAVGAVHACVGAAQTPAMAFAESHHEGGCAKTVNQNACLQQCMADNQSTAQVQLAVAEMPALPVLTVLAALDSSARLPEAVIVLARSPGPPPSIRFCSFQL
jgi:hypothetical protein